MTIQGGSKMGAGQTDFRPNVNPAFSLRVGYPIGEQQTQTFPVCGPKVMYWLRLQRYSKYTVLGIDFYGQT